MVGREKEAIIIIKTQKCLRQGAIGSGLLLGRENHSLFRMWPLVVFPYSSGWSHAMYTWATVTGFSGLQKKDTILRNKVYWGIWVELEGISKVYIFH